METQADIVRTQPQANLAKPPSAMDVAKLPAERRLVQRVVERCGEVIQAACASSSVPAEFLGALVANESGGCADATRFEPGVYRHLQAVAQGQSPAYGSINVTELDEEAARLLPANDATLHARYLSRAFAANHAAEIHAAREETLRQLATSWGYTQIMGYHMIGQPWDVRHLLDPQFHFRMAIRLLSEFAVDYQINPAAEFAEMFCCWNTGRPYGRTFDPHYVEKGLRRMQIYGQLQRIQTAAR